MNQPRVLWAPALDGSACMGSLPPVRPCAGAVPGQGSPALRTTRAVRGRWLST